MKLHTLKPAPGSVKKSKRIGRGQGSGKGGTATRGHKGAKSRSGYTRKLGFEGGQLPLQRRIPMYKLKASKKTIYKPISLDMLQQLAEKAQIGSIDEEVLVKHGLLSKRGIKYKILGSGTLKTQLEVIANAFSASALKAIEQVGGKAVKPNTHE